MSDFERPDQEGNDVIPLHVAVDTTNFCVSIQEIMNPGFLRGGHKKTHPVLANSVLDPHTVSSIDVYSPEELYKKYQIVFSEYLENVENAQNADFTQVDKGIILQIQKFYSNIQDLPANDHNNLERSECHNSLWQIHCQLCDTLKISRRQFMHEVNWERLSSAVIENNRVTTTEESISRTLSNLHDTDISISM
jgi:hypothetical protein